MKKPDVSIRLFGIVRENVVPKTSFRELRPADRDSRYWLVISFD